MLKKELILRNPLRWMGRENQDILPAGGLGALMARAGVGKTAFMVQIALNSLLHGKNVLHVSLNEPVQKVSLWYEEVISHLAEQFAVKNTQEFWEAVLPHRFIMTFRVEGFSAISLEERLNELTDQDIFLPQIIIIDGLPFDSGVRNPLSDLKSLARRQGLQIWFTIRTHRHEAPSAEGLPAPFAPVEDLFEIALQLQPIEREIHVKPLKGGPWTSDPTTLLLDPNTMIIKPLDDIIPASSSA